MNQNMSTKHLIAAVEELRKFHAVVAETIATAETAIKQKQEAATPTAISISAGTLFRRLASETTSVYIKCRPTSFLLNSNLVADAMGAGKVLICNIDTGSTFFIKGEEPVQIKD